MNMSNSTAIGVVVLTVAMALVLPVRASAGPCTHANKSSYVIWHGHAFDCSEAKGQDLGPIITDEQYETVLPLICEEADRIGYLINRSQALGEKLPAKEIVAETKSSQPTNIEYIVNKFHISPDRASGIFRQTMYKWRQTPDPSMACLAVTAPTQP